MAKPIEFETERLRLRQWQAADRAPFAALNADPRVMAYFPRPLTRAESDQVADRCQAVIAAHGWGLWATECKASREFIGFVGLYAPGLPCSPCVDIAWHLAHSGWGRGLASEAAKAVLRVGFEALGLPEIVAYTPLRNHRSRAVMERLGMQASGLFEHPQLPEGSALRLHRLYRLARDRFAA